jgi:hypothetical protein
VGPVQTVTWIRFGLTLPADYRDDELDLVDDATTRNWISLTILMAGMRTDLPVVPSWRCERSTKLAKPSQGGLIRHI